MIEFPRDSYQFSPRRYSAEINVILSKGIQKYPASFVSTHSLTPQRMFPGSNNKPPISSLRAYSHQQHGLEEPFKPLLSSGVMTLDQYNEVMNHFSAPGKEQVEEVLSRRCVVWGNSILFEQEVARILSTGVVWFLPVR